MNPASARAAGREVELLARKQFKGTAKATFRRRIPRAGAIAQLIWIRWNVGIYRWQLKHVRWLLMHGLATQSLETRYQYWLCVRSLLQIVGKERWLPSLRGSWCWPTEQDRDRDRCSTNTAESGRHACSRPGAKAATD